MRLLIILALSLCSNLGAATWYVFNSGSGADGLTCNTGFTSVANAIAHPIAAGDQVNLCSGHAETTAASVTLTFPGTVSSINTVLCTNASGSTAATATATNCSVTVTGTSSLTTAGTFYWYGTTFNIGTGAGADIMNVATASNVSASQTFEACAFKLITTGSGKINLGPITSPRDVYIELINTTMQFAATNQLVAPGMARIIWRGTSSAITGSTFPTTLIIPGGAVPGSMVMSGIDLSALGSGKNLVSIGVASTSVYDIYIRNCKLGASVALTTGAITGSGATRVFVDNTDSAATNYTFTHFKYQGSITQSTTTFKNSGASDGTTPISWQMVTLATGPLFRFPLESPPIYVWNDNSGSPRTLTIEFISSGSLNNSQIWSECEYLGTSSFPLSVYANNRSADEFASAVAQASSSATWTTGIATPTAQKLVLSSITPQNKGLFRCIVKVAAASQTVYIDPVVNIQ